MATETDDQLATGVRDEVVAARIEDWRRRLIDLSYDNRLVKYAHRRASTLVIQQPDVTTIFERVERGQPWSFYFPPDPDEADDNDTSEAASELDEAVVSKARAAQGVAAGAKASELVVTERHPRRLNRILETLARKSNSEFQDKALRVLYVAAGFLDWIDPTRGEKLSSPLVLVPVRLERKSASEPYRLYFVDDEATVVNPSLVEKLRYDIGLDLPDDFGWEDKPVLTELDEIQAAVSPHGWKVRHDVVLGLFSFQKYVMYRDLLDNADLVAGHSLVRSLAGKKLEPDISPAEIPLPEKLDDTQPAASTFSILDADASQRVCIEASKRGQSFVMHGPPGTGKSQTIANVIAEAIADGKRVLFVSEKAAALDVVRNRLRAEGLGEYCLMLHGEHASRREVVESLYAALTGELVPRLSLEPSECDRLDRLRELLNNQVVTLHEPQSLLGDRSIREVYAELASLHAAPVAPGAPPPDGLASAELRAKFATLDDIFARLAERWDVGSSDYVWRGFDAERFSSDDRARVSTLLERARNTSLVLRQHAEVVADRLGLGAPTSASEIEQLIQVGEHLVHAPGVEAQWLDGSWHRDALAVSSEAKAFYERLEHAEQEFVRNYPIRTIDDFRADLCSCTAAALETLKEVAGWRPSLDEQLLAVLPQLQTALRAIPEQVAAVQRRLAELTALLGQPEKDGSAERIDELVELARLAFRADHRPEQEWLVRAGLDRAQTTLAELRPVFENYQSHWQQLQRQWATSALDLPVEKLLADYEDWTAMRARLLESWTEEGLSLPAPELLERFRSDHTSTFAKLKGSYRRDAKLIRGGRRDAKLPTDPVAELEDLAQFQAAGSALASAVTVARVRGDMPDDVVAALEDLAGLQSEGAAVDAVACKAAEAFGSYFDGRETELAHVERAIRLAEQAVDLRHPDSDLVVLSGQLCVGARPNATLAQAADQLEAAKRGLQQELEVVQPHIERFDEFFGGATLETTARCAANLLAPTENVDAFVSQVQAGAVVPARSTRELLERARAIEDLHTLRRQIADHQRRWAEVAGPSFQGRDTDWSVIETAAEWIEELHELTGEALSPQIAEQLIGEPRWPDIAGLKDALEAYLEAADDVVDWFEEPRRSGLSGLVQDDPLAFDDMCKDLLAQVDSLYDWTDFRHFRRRAREEGWDEFVEGLLAHEITADDVQRAFHRAFWSRQIEALFNEEPELEDDFRGRTYQRFIDKFCELDRRLVRTAADRLIAQRNRRRHAHVNIAGSEVSVLRREAGKRKRHMPVRQLLSKIPNLLSELKPCLMMSPMSVSHFLSPTHRFDLVIFDEASQVPPQDAINCIYRGDQLIVAGDSKQLPPTAFFQVADIDDTYSEEDDAEEDMESVLDACKALLPEHQLNWHYRSRHEDLIAFSNREIYDERLITFPTPDHISADMGVTFRYVPNGVYDRGNTHTNRQEAKVVASRVADYLQNGSGRSVGVIAFSKAQATAIADELDRLRLEDPDLDEQFSNDRLDGPFVKHLEAVQGDERDVILFSVGYGRDAEGAFTMNFGPLNKAGGHRRLNVAVTRARQKIEVIASVRATDFKLSDSASLGVRLLRDYLEYAEQSGSQRAPEDLGDDEHHAVSDLERDIAREIENFGLRAAHQVGAGLMRVDIGVIDPANPDRFILGVESDGRGYSQTPTARDRERLRAEVLAGLGWRIHRIWSLDWVRDRESEKARLAEAIEQARDPDRRGDAQDGNAREPERSRPRERVERPIVDLRDPDSLDHLPWVNAYQRVELPWQSDPDFHRASLRSLQASFAARILEGEAPVHIEYLIRRLAEAWGIQRVGSRVEAAARQAISQAARRGNFERRGDFYWRSGQEVTHVRRPVPGDPRTRRDIAQIPPAERQLALRRLVEAGGAASDDDLLAAASRLLGFDRLGESIRATLKRDLRALRKVG